MTVNGVRIPAWAIGASGLLIGAAGAGWAARGGVAEKDKDVAAVSARVTELERDTTAMTRLPAKLDSLGWRIGKIEDDMREVRAGVHRLEGRVR